MGFTLKFDVPTMLVFLIVIMVQSIPLYLFELIACSSAIEL